MACCVVSVWGEHSSHMNKWKWNGRKRITFSVYLISSIYTKYTVKILSVCRRIVSSSTFVHTHTGHTVSKHIHMNARGTRHIERTTKERKKEWAVVGVFNISNVTMCTIWPLPCAYAHTSYTHTHLCTARGTVNITNKRLYTYIVCVPVKSPTVLIYQKQSTRGHGQCLLSMATALVSSCTNRCTLEI